MDKGGFVYIMTNHKHGTLYVGVTSDLPARAYQHKRNLTPGYTSRYALHDLVYFERHDDIRDAIAREKQLKRWHRAWKIELVESQNKSWRDLYSDLF